MSLDVAAMRQSYARERLSEVDADPDPVKQFGLWFEAACGGEIMEPNAMMLATADDRGHPSCRTVLLKGFDARGFAFYTNLESRKSEAIKANPYAALLFYWDKLHRQVRIEGGVVPVEPAEADAYFASRPHGSRIGAVASPQSRLIERADLEARVEALEAEYPDDAPVPRPGYWGGWRVVPERFEFWQGRTSRLHDRLVYARGGDGWKVARLAP